MTKLYTPGFLILIVLWFSPAILLAQSTGSNSNGSSLTAIPTAVPFLNISPDSRSGAMGDAGVALSPDANANYWNPSKLAFIADDDAVSLSYSPWLRHLVPDISLSYLSYAHKLDPRDAFGLSLRFFNYGGIQLTGNDASNQGTYTPSEFSIDGSFARKFGEDFSLGLTLRYIHSNLSNANFSTGSGQTKAGNAVGADVSFYYKKNTEEFGSDALFAFGIDLSNIGSKVSYSDNGPAYFLPTNLKIGAANTWYLDDYNAVTATLDLNKLCVPLPGTDANGNYLPTDDISVPSGFFKSFSNYQGYKDITYSPALEYGYNKQFFLRAGYFYESPDRGDRHYLTLGFGLKYDIFIFDFAYLAASQADSPLANTLRFTLSANFGTAK